MNDSPPTEDKVTDAELARLIDDWTPPRDSLLSPNKRTALAAMRELQCLRLAPEPPGNAALLAATQDVYISEHLHRDRLLAAARDLEEHYGTHGPENTKFRNYMDNLRAAIKWHPPTKEPKHG